MSRILSLAVRLLTIVVLFAWAWEVSEFLVANAEIGRSITLALTVLIGLIHFWARAVLAGRLAIRAGAFALLLVLAIHAANWLIAHPQIGGVLTYISSWGSP